MPPRRTILIVEDDTDLRGMFRTALTLSGYRVIEAGDGLGALNLLDSDRPDLVILDLGLPIVSGHVVRQEIAAQAHTRDIPIVVVTGTHTTNERLDVTCLLHKPVAVEELVLAVKKCLTVGTANGA